MTTIEVALFSLGFKDMKSAEEFCKRLETDSRDGVFVYQGKEFRLPPIPPGCNLVAEYGENDVRKNKRKFPVKVDILIVPKPNGGRS